ncbi:FAD:protein FMN transferase [Nocardioides ungokensis]|uniref:FAD:protein FMN transferase n=1 Tax=Nocardioides ungokensis TaxID=1643322 RepID=UPI0015DF65BC|nr:FAD:protein FMN transferase [Nocardioides ungokensis]
MSGTARFRALGTDVFVAVRTAADLPRARRLAADVLTDVDEVCSRFRPDSDLCLVNANPGRWVDVDPLLVTAVEVACRAADATGGLVNPLLGRPLTFLGYDRDFRLLVDCEDEETVAETPLPDRDRWRDVRTDPAGGVRIPPGTALDLGATGKAWAADLIATAYAEHLRGSAVVSVGGDLCISSPDAIPWEVAVTDLPDEPPVVVTLDRGGLTTSSTRVRRWTRRGARRHHLLDRAPATPRRRCGARSRRPARPARPPTRPAPPRSSSARPPRPGSTRTT